MKLGQKYVVTINFTGTLLFLLTDVISTIFVYRIKKRSQL